jgi:aspartyl-tRNA(Asn)/glutamyl-tRNA(Gln) amidotransferase subunit C
MSQIDINKLKILSQLSLNSTETSAAYADLVGIMAMIDTMQAIDTEGVSPLAHPLDGTQRLRADEVTEIVDREKFQKIAPATEDGLYLVPRVIE